LRSRPGARFLHIRRFFGDSGASPPENLHFRRICSRSLRRSQIAMHSAPDLFRSCHIDKADTCDCDFPSLVCAASAIIISEESLQTYSKLRYEERCRMTVPTPLKPPFTLETALAKVKAAEDAWNTRDPERVALAYTPDSVWRNRGEFFQGREAIKAFLQRKWAKELDYKLMKELWCYEGNRISVRFEYEWRDAASGKWMRTHGNEHWEFDEEGLMRRRDMSANDYPIAESERRYR
jgi:hypothetical protein